MDHEPQADAEPVEQDTGDACVEIDERGRAMLPEGVRRDMMEVVLAVEGRWEAREEVI